ncbi:unnamed protein product, partial [Rotaria sp. Silwood2]
QSYDQRHSAYKIAAEGYNVLRELDIEQKVTSVTCDGANNMQKAFDMSNEVDRFWCVAHRLHLTICNGLALWKKFKNNENESSRNGVDLEEPIDVRTLINEDDLKDLEDDEIEDESNKGNILLAAV